MSWLKFLRLFAFATFAALLCLNLCAPLPAQLSAASSSQTATPQADRVSAMVDSGERVVLSGHRPGWLDDVKRQNVRDLGPVPDTRVVELIVGLTRAATVQAAFDQLTEDQQNQSSSRYHHWLTPAEVGTGYGPTQHDLDAVTTWLTAQGLHIDLVQPNRIFIQVSGSAKQVAAAFGTSLHTYARGNDVVQAPSGEPLVPVALAAVLQNIGGLTDVPRHTHMKMTLPIKSSATNVGRNAAGSSLIHPDMALSGGNNFIAPNDFTVLYDLSPVYNTAKGAGQKVMVIGGSRLNPPDLANWESLSRLAPYTPNYIVGPAFTDPGQTDDDNMGEGTLDFERVYATAPGAIVDQVIAKNWLSGATNFNLVSYAINAVNDPVMSLSFGACEALEPAGFVQQESTLYQQAAAQGISVFASSGDSGVDGCESHGVAAQSSPIASISDICASPYVTCVGGTQFNDTTNTPSYWATTNSAGYQSALRFIPEGGWNEPTSTSSTGVVSYVVSASGGGASTIIAKPSWQVGAGVPADGFRDVPDVSFSASVHNAYFSCLAYAGGSCVTNAMGNFGLVGFGGTSASAPSMAGVAALIDQSLSGRQGNLNPLLYRVFNSSAGPSAFHDATIATSGASNCVAATPSPCNNSDPSPTALTGGLAGYLLQPGFDEVTGLGSLDVSNFVTAAVASGVMMGPTFTLSSASSTLTLASGSSAGGTNVITLTPANGFSGSVSFFCTATLIGGTATVSPGCAVNPGSITYPAVNTTTVTISTIAPHAVRGSGLASTNPSRGLAGLVGAVGFAGLLGLALPRLRRRYRWRALAAMLLTTAALSGLAGCSGKTAAAPAPPPLSGGTTTGTYTVTVTGTATTGIPAASTTFTVTVN